MHLKTNTPLPLEGSVEKSAVNRNRGPKPKRPEPMVCLVGGQECVKIPLTKNKWAIVDKADLALVVKFFWQAKKYGRNAKNVIWYASRRLRVSECGERKTRHIKLHQFLADSDMIDHKNGDGLDNRRCNLRAADNSHNQANSRIRVDSTSGVKGVHFRPATGTRRSRWVARIGGGAGRISLGSFQSKEEALLAYNAAAIKRWGEFAKTNTTNTNTNANR